MSTVRSNDGTLIAYDKSGSGVPVILVDGAMCSRNFGPMGGLAPLLAPHFTVYKYDRRGRGESTDTQPYAVEREIEDIASLIAEAGGSAYVYGTSSGAALALEAAACGLAITKLALYEPPFIVDQTRPILGADYAAEMKSLLAEGRRGDAVAHFMTVGIGIPAEFVEGMRQQPHWGMMEAVAPTLAYDTDIMSPYQAGRPLNPQRWAAITMPVLVMGGTAASETMTNAVKATARALPGSELRILEGQTHDVAADAMAPELIAFFGR